MKIVYPTWFELQFNDNNGKPLTSGLVYTKRSDSGANAVTYNANDEPNTNPVVLDLNGRAVIRLDSSFAYKFIVHDSNDVLVYERDKVYGTEFINTGTSTDHDDLDNRDIPDQHPTSAITGLDTALSAITGDVSQLIIDVTNLEGGKVNRSGDTMTGSLEVQTALRLYYDTSDPFTNQGAIDTFAGEDYASMYLTSDMLDNTKRIDSFVGLSYSSQTVKNGNSNQIYSYVSADQVDLQVTREDGNSKIEALLIDDGLGNPKADLIIGVTNHSLQVQALSTRTQLVNTDGASVDTLLLPTVTGATKTLATLSDIPTTLPPTAHASSHGVAGSDPITIAQSQVTNLATDLGLKAPLESPSFTGVVTAQAFKATANRGVGVDVVTIESNDPTFAIVDLNSALNEKRFRVSTVSGVTYFSTRADADTSGSDWFYLTRSGTTPTGMVVVAPLTYNSTKSVSLRINSNTTLSGSVKNITFYGSTASQVIDIPLATGSGLELTVRNIASVPVTLNFVGSTFYGSATFVLDPNETIELFDDLSTLWI